MGVAEIIAEGKASLGIEFGSTRIKAVLIDDKGNPLASGGHGWENQFEDGVWTYSKEAIWAGIKDCYKELKEDVKKQYGVTLTSFASMGISAMMHGYLAFDEKDELLVPFRTWRNTMTADAQEKLTAVFNYNIPQRWSIAHLYQALLNKEEHTGKIKFFTTLAGYVHYVLTGEKVLGVGDASGMFPIDINTGDYDKTMIEKFDALPEVSAMPWKLEEILPKSLSAGEAAGVLTEEGAKLLDPDGDLKAGVKLCPPEGDAGTGMVATNSVAVRTGNISAGTSVFAMVVLEKDLSKVYPEIDLVTTPDGKLVGMVHCNNCTSEINAWVNLFKEFMEEMGIPVDMNKLFTTLYTKAMDGDPDCGGLMSYNYFSGEPVTGFAEGAPLFARNVSNSSFTLGNFMRMHLYSALGALKVGLDILLDEEKVKVDSMLGHGGYFKTPGVGQSIAAAAINAPVSVMETAGEGGAWGAAILAGYLANKEDGESLPDYLNNNIFASMKGSSIEPDKAAVDGFNKFMETYKKGLAMEKAAVEVL